MGDVLWGLFPILLGKGDLSTWFSFMHGNLFSKWLLEQTLSMLLLHPFLVRL
jgi:hypothetical protein